MKSTVRIGTERTRRDARRCAAISAVIFLVSAEYDMPFSTYYIIDRVENGDYDLSIAYPSVLVLVLVMLAAILPIQVLVGERRLGRRGAGVQFAPRP